MRKTLLSVVLAALCSLVTAQTFHAFPWELNPYLASIRISPNGKYIGGMDYAGMLFLADWNTLDIMQIDPPTDVATGCIRDVNSQGIAVGFNGDMAFSCDLNSNVTVLFEGEEGAIADGITEDGTIICGKTNTADSPKACIWKNGVIQYLPEPTDEWLGIKSFGTAADFISSDGSIIVGHLVDKLSTRPMLVWVRNKDGETYSCVPVFKRFCTEKTADGKGLQSYFTPTGLSGNGEWAAVTVSDDQGNLCMGRYNLLTDQLDYITTPDMKTLVGFDGFITEGTGIADDGTILGMYGDAEQGVRWSLYCKGDEYEAKLLSDAFPTLTELKHYDATQYNVAADITPDGRYITGHATDYVMIEGEQCQIFVSYVIDTWTEAMDVKSVQAVENVNGKEEVFSIDGKKLNDMKASGILISKDAFGKSKKLIRK